MEPFIIDQQLTLFPRHLERQHQQQQKTSAAKKLKFFYGILTCASVRSVFYILHAPKFRQAPVTEGATYPWQAGADASGGITTFES